MAQDPTRCVKCGNRRESSIHSTTSMNEGIRSMAHEFVEVDAIPYRPETKGKVFMFLAAAAVVSVLIVAVRRALQ